MNQIHSKSEKAAQKSGLFYVATLFVLEFELLLVMKIPDNGRIGDWLIG